MKSKSPAPRAYLIPANPVKPPVLPVVVTKDRSIMRYAPDNVLAICHPDLPIDGSITAPAVRRVQNPLSSMVKEKACGGPSSPGPTSLTSTHTR